MTSAAWGYFAIYAIALLALGLIGAFVARSFKLSHTTLQLLLSLAGGLLLGVACLHLLPHAIEANGSWFGIGMSFLVGILSVYMVLRFFDGPALSPDAAPCTKDHSEHAAEHHGSGRSSWLAMTGFGIHALLDGIAICAAIAAAVAADASSAWPGLAAVFAVAMHKPIDTFSASILVDSRATRRSSILPLIALSLATPIAAGVLLLLVPSAVEMTQNSASYAMAFGAGVLLCVALADVLPEVRFHGHDRLKLGAGLLLGVSVAAGIAHVEHLGHDHGHADHAGHDH